MTPHETGSTATPGAPCAATSPRTFGSGKMKRDPVAT